MFCSVSSAKVEFPQARNLKSLKRNLTALSENFIWKTFKEKKIKIDNTDKTRGMVLPHPNATA